MTYGLVYDGPPMKCAKGARPGTKALRDGCMRLFPGVTDVGIFNCRPTRNKGSKTLSFHADGRAWDAGCSGDLNAAVFRWAILNADALGIQEAISQRRRWDARTGRIEHYDGDDPHTEHVHISQCIRAANTLTVATVLATKSAPTKPAPQEDDMRIFTITDGAEKGKYFLVSGDTRQYISASKVIDELKAAGVPVAGISDVTWQMIVNATALDIAGLRSLPSPQRDQLKNIEAQGGEIIATLGSGRG